MKLTLRQANERDEILFGEPYNKTKYCGGCRRFDALSAEDAQKLMTLGFIDPEDTQNCSPTAQEILDFCLDGSGKWQIHGYAISIDRSDCRVTFEGLQSDGPLTASEALDFVMEFRFADELCAEDGGGAWCWYD